MKSTVLTIAACLGTAALGAAQGGAARFMPAKATISFEVDGPAKFIERFADTNFGAMMASQDFGDLWARAMTLADDAMAAEGDVPPEAKELWDVVRTTFGAYEGRVTGAVSLEMRGFEDPPKFTFVVACSPSDETDFSEVVRLMAEAAAESGDVLTAATTGGGDEVELVKVDEDISLMLPVINDGHLVFAVGQLDAWIAQLGAEDADEAGGSAASQTAEDAGAHIRVDRSLWSSLVSMLRSSDDFEIVRALDVLGPMIGRVETLGDLTFTLRPAGKYTETVAEIGFASDEPHLFELLWPEGATPRDLLPLMPRDGSSIDSVSFNVPALIEAAKEMLAGGEFTFEQAEEQVAQNLGLQLRADLLDHIAGTAMWGTSVDPEFEDVSIYVALGLKDGAAFEKSIDKALRSQGMHAGRKTEEYRGRNTYQLNLGFFALTWAFTDKALLLGFGTEPGEAVRVMLDGDNARVAGDDPEPWPAEIAKRIEALPQGWGMISIAWGGALGVEATADALLADALPYPENELEERAAQLLREFVQLCGRFDVLSSVTGTYMGKSKATTRTLM